MDKINEEENESDFLNISSSISNNNNNNENVTKNNENIVTNSTNNFFVQDELEKLIKENKILNQSILNKDKLIFEFQNAISISTNKINELSRNNEFLKEKLKSNEKKNLFLNEIKNIKNNVNIMEKNFEKKINEKNNLIFDIQKENNRIKNEINNLNKKINIKIQNLNKEKKILLDKINYLESKIYVINLNLN